MISIMIQDYRFSGLQLGMGKLYKGVAQVQFLSQLTAHSSAQFRAA